MTLLILPLLVATFVVDANRIVTQTDEYQNSTIRCNPDTNCTIDCQTTSGCENSHIVCPSNGLCNIRCSAATACKSAIIQCPVNNTCDISCSAKNSCQDSLINATHSSLFNLHEFGSGYHVATGIIIYFPPYDTNRIPRANIIGNQHSEAAGTESPLAFYAVHGWADINIADFVYPYGSMHCLSDYSHSCSFAINVDVFQCNNTNDVCEDGTYATSNPTMEPTTKEPTTYTAITATPTISPTLIPSLSPTSQTMCVWNAVDSWDHINGEYLKQNGTHNTYPYWKHISSSCTNQTYYIFASYYKPDASHFWFIHPTLVTDYVVAYPDCEDQPLSATPDICPGGYYEWYSDANKIQLTLSVTAGSCPSLQCDIIQITGITTAQHTICNKVFTRNTQQDNVFVYRIDSNSTLYLYFNQYTFRWYCSETLGVDDCADDINITHQYISSLTDGWIDITVGDTATITMSNNEDVSFQCSITASPTLDPTSSPSMEPTTNTMIPTLSPSTLLPTIFLCEPIMDGINAKWSSSYMSIFVYIPNNNALSVINMNALPANCADIFDDRTYMNLLYLSTCQWMMNSDDSIYLRVDLSSESSINATSIMALQLNITYICATSDAYTHRYEMDTIIHSIQAPIYLDTPHIIISSFPPQIGVCDDLILDARSSTNLGGRNNALFEWRVISATNESVYYQGKYIEILSNDLTKDSVYNIQLTVTNWYGAISTKSMNVIVSSNALPLVSLQGISTYTATNLNLNGVITIDANIVFNDECLQNMDRNLKLNMSRLSWNVFADKMDAEDPTDINNKLTELQNWIVSVSTTALSVNVDTYLQNGFMYTFALRLQCLPPFNCDIQSTHEVVYDYNAIQCDIMPNDVILTDIDPTQLKGFQLLLNGDILTYDTNNKLDSTHLNWYWRCINVLNADESCTYLIQNNDIHASIINVNIGNLPLNYSQSYLFRFMMEVYDASNSYRDNCTDSIVIDISTKNISSPSTKQFIVVANALDSQINANNRLRLFGDILNYDLMELTDGVMEYQWIEVNEELTTEQIEEYAQTTHDSINFILKEGVLTEGEQYVFQLKVFQYASAEKTDKVGFGESSPISIYVLKPPQIMTDSFAIEPSCYNVVYSNITSLLRTPHTLTINADGDNAPLLYQFGYDDNTKTYFTPSLLYTSTLSDIYLPAIDTFSVFGTVLDSKSSTTSASLPCSVRLQSYAECIDFKTYILTHSDIVSSYTQQYRYIYQQSHIYLNYLLHNDTNEECIEHSLDDILDVLSSMYMLCETSHPISLTENLLSILQLISHRSKSDLIVVLKQLLYAVLDPCYYIRNNTETIEHLTVSTHSIITKIPMILNQNTQDITPYLSVIISNPNYHYLLYSLTSSIIDMFQYTHDITLANVLSSAVYISELIRMSSSIPGEKTYTDFADFSIYSMRVNNEDIAITIQNISVFISNRITNAYGDDLFDAVDILLVGMETSANHNVSTAPSTDCNNAQGTLSNNSISISILSNVTNTAHLASNISFSFQCDASCQEIIDTFSCVWYNESSDLWLNDGCITLFVDDEIQCLCSHLTTFATIHNIHSSDCKSSVMDWMQSTQWKYINWIASAIFFIIFLYSVIQLFPYYVCTESYRRYFNWKQRNVLAMTSLAVTAILFCISCLLSLYIHHLHIDGVQKDLMMKMHVLFLLLPQVTYFILFSIIFYSWFVLAHGFIKNIQDVEQRMRISLAILNIFIFCLLCCYCVLVFRYPENNKIFELGAYIWSGLLTVIAIIVVIYSYLVGKTLLTAAKISAKQNFARKDWIVVRRLLTINTVIALFRIYQSFCTIHLAINSSNQTLEMSTVYLAVDVLNLCLICWMYRSSMMQEKQQMPDSGDSTADKNRLWSKFSRKTSNTRSINFSRRKSDAHAFAKRKSKSAADNYGGYRPTTPSTPWTPTADPDADKTKTEDDEFQFPETGTKFMRLKTASRRSTIVPLDMIEEEKAKHASSEHSVDFDETEAKLTFDAVDGVDIIYDDDEFNNILEKRHSNTLTQNARITEFGPNIEITQLARMELAETNSVSMNSKNPFGAELDIPMSVHQLSLSIEIPDAANTNPKHQTSTSKHQPYVEASSDSNMQFTPSTLLEIENLTFEEEKNETDSLDVIYDINNELMLMDHASSEQGMRWMKVRSDTNASNQQSPIKNELDDVDENDEEKSLEIEISMELMDEDDDECVEDTAKGNLNINQFDSTKL